MANKIAKYTFIGANQDVTKSKHSPEFYYEANHITLVSKGSQSTGSISNEKGNKKVIEIPNIELNVDNKTFSYNSKTLSFTNTEILDQIFENNTPTNISINDNIIIGHATGKNNIILFTTNSQGIDCIWEITNVIEKEYHLTLLYVKKLNF